LLLLVRLCPKSEILAKFIAEPTVNDDSVTDWGQHVAVMFSGFPRLLESPGFFFFKISGPESSGKSLWSWKVLEIEV